MNIKEQGCGSCAFYRAGECRREAPKLAFVVQEGRSDHAGVWPQVESGGWCGMYFPLEAVGQQQSRIAVPVAGPQTLKLHR